MTNKWACCDKPDLNCCYFADICATFRYVLLAVAGTADDDVQLTADQRIKAAELMHESLATAKF